MRRLTAIAGWEIRGDAPVPRRVDDRVLPLLRAIAQSATLVSAARACAVPYRTAWGLLEDSNRDLGAPLVTLARGRGAALTPLAQRWLALADEARRKLDEAALVVSVRAAPARASARAAPLVRIAASHDIALAQLKDRWRVSHAIAIEFHGSAASLDSFDSGKVDIAGFHVADRAGSADPLLARLNPARDTMLRFITRKQGLILPRGNPRRVRALADIAAKRLTIVNRQSGSGTRLLFDRLLAKARIAPGALAGYTNEEFTHAAVAATVAAGRADAGFGIQAAAAQFGLAFVPLATERYLFACRRKALDTPRIEAFRALLASAATRAVVAPLPGYALDAPGEALSPVVG